MYTSPALKQYFRAIRKRLSCRNREKKAVLDSIRMAVEDFRQAHPDATDDEILRHFGSVEEIIGQYDDAESRFVPRRMRCRTGVAACMALAALVFLLLILLFAGRVCQDDIPTTRNGRTAVASDFFMQ